MILTAEMRTMLRGLLSAPPGEWYISGCPICSYTEHTPSPSERCPNDGVPLIRFDGRIASWDKLAEAKAQFQPDPVLVAVADGIRGVVGAVND